MRRKECGYEFLNRNGDFRIENPDASSGLYFPIAGEAGIKSSLTPNLGGDCKVSQNQFVMEPVSVENLHNNKSTRNFWCHTDLEQNWSATGASAENRSRRFSTGEEPNSLEGGFMWQKISRSSDQCGLASTIVNFVPISENVEIMDVTIRNTGLCARTITPTGVVPLFGRSADNIRDHRHVTALLHRIWTLDRSVCVRPTMSFDERGHKRNIVTYFVSGVEGDGIRPDSFFPITADYIGEGGDYEWPEAVIRNRKGVSAGFRAEGEEASGAIRFKARTLQPGEEAHYQIIVGYVEQENEQLTEQEIERITERFETAEAVKKELEETKKYWNEKVNISFTSGDPRFDAWMRWVTFQPELRRIYGCSFLPHHDYGKGGRGWRDLWQDCLALLMMNPTGVRELLLNNFAGVRIDGTNATIIGAKPGEFIADRNSITRVWMDHGVWPFITTMLYIQQTGDLQLLEEDQIYFKDEQVNDVSLKTDSGEVYRGSVLEHLLVQNLTAFYEVGEHNLMRLRGADWNDALDMAAKRGESVAFTGAYAGNYVQLADLLENYSEKTGRQSVVLAKELLILLPELHTQETAECNYDSLTYKKEILDRYYHSCLHTVLGERYEIPVEVLVQDLRSKAEWLQKKIRQQEWITDGEGRGWFNSYYDNDGNQVEGIVDGNCRMMLTGQVFQIMSGTASEEQTRRIAESADQYLYQKDIGGYRLNTNFHELKMNLGRMFGFAYGQKENGAVFSHMTVMYANALYQRGFGREGYKALNALYEQAVDFDRSRIYPGIPEYFNGQGRGMYHYLTGAASWYLLTVLTQVYGVHGEYGDLVITPHLMPEQFDEQGEASVTFTFAGRRLRVVLHQDAPGGVCSQGVHMSRRALAELPQTAEPYTIHVGTGA